MKQGLVTLLYNFAKRFMGWTLHMIMCVLLCYPLSIHMSQLLSTGHPISSFYYISITTLLTIVTNILRNHYLGFIYHYECKKAPPTPNTSPPFSAAQDRSSPCNFSEGDKSPPNIYKKSPVIKIIHLKMEI